MESLTLWLTPASKPGNFIARLGGDIICQSDQPLLDGARELLKRGYDPERLLTCQHEGSAHASFVPQPIREWAQWTFSETDRDGLRKQRWRPRPEGSFLPTGKPENGVP